MMTISGLKVTNYKSFKNASFRIDPLTVLVGTNSAGKSSLLQVILLLAQTFNSDAKRHDALKLFGKYVEMGEPISLLFNKEKDKKLAIEINLQNPINFALHLKRVALKIIAEARGVITEYVDLLEYIVDPDDLISKRKIAKGSRYKRPFMKTLWSTRIQDAITPIKQFRNILKDYEDEIEEFNEIDVYDADEWTIKDEIRSLGNYDTKELKKVWSALKALKKIDRMTGIKFEFKYDEKKDCIALSSVSLKSDAITIFELSYYAKNNRQINSIKSDVKEIASLTTFKKTVFNLFEFRGLTMQWRSRNLFGTIPNHAIRQSSSSYLIYSIYSYILNRISKFFQVNGIRHVSPIRAYPKRFYVTGDVSDIETWDTFNSDILATILKSKPEIKEKINYWLKRLDIEIDLERLNYILHSIKVKQNDLTLDLSDVGFGISQILPVIIQPIIAPKNSITIIEQPEIHIHPKAQADLADFFINIVNTTGKKLIIETHSESFLKRLRRRMAESNENLLDSISTDKVSIHYIKRRRAYEEGSTIENIDISCTGSFKWPKEFVDTELDDTVNYLKYQK